MDTRSMNTMSHAADALRAHDITLDGVVVCASNFELPALARFSGGHSLLPGTAEAAIAAFEADPMLLLAWRAEAAQRWNDPIGSSLSTPTSPSLPQSLRALMIALSLDPSLEAAFMAAGFASVSDLHVSDLETKLKSVSGVNKKMRRKISRWVAFKSA